MKLLYFTYDFPVPITSGGKNRAYHMLKYGTKGIDVTLFSFYRDIPDNDSIATIESLGIKNIRLFKRSIPNFKTIAEQPVTFLKDIPGALKLANPTSSITKKLYFKRDVLRELITTIKEEEIDVVHFESLYTAYYMSSQIRNVGVKQIFGTENIEYTLYEDYARQTARKPLMPIYLFEANKIKHDEENLLRLADYTMAVSKKDADFVTKITHAPTAIIENGVDIKTFAFKARQKNKTKTLLFVGNFSYFPNVSAIEDFYRDVFCNLKTKNITLKIIGMGVNQLAISDSRVEMVEYVKDIRDAYYRADLFVFPIKIGGGTNFKIVEAMACGLPVVGYAGRLKAMKANSDVAFSVKTADEFVKTLDNAIESTDNSFKIAKNARQFIEANYSWEVIGEKLNKYWTEIGDKR